jgi:anti-sigma B factor antagonist
VTFTITVQRTATVTRLCVTGDLDIGTTGQFDRAVSEALRTRPGSLLVDLAATTFCDCTGITALLVARRAAVAQDVAYQVLNPTGVCLLALRILDLQSLLTTRT